MFLRRKSDAFVYCDDENISPQSWWRPRNHHYAEIPTVTGVAYPDSRGVAQLYQKVRFYFADHYPGATLGKYQALWQAQRRLQILQFQDRKGDIYDVRITDRIDENTTSKWDEVVSKEIVILEVEVMRLDYFA